MVSYYMMGSIHSNNRDAKISSNDLRLVREEAEKLFAMDSRSTTGKCSEHTKQNSHCTGSINSSHRMITNGDRRSIRRIFESMNRGTIKGAAYTDGTANSTCDNSPNFSKMITLPTAESSIGDSQESIHVKQNHDQHNVTLRNNLRPDSSILPSNSSSIDYRLSQGFIGEGHMSPFTDQRSEQLSTKSKSRNIPVNGQMFPYSTSSLSTDNNYDEDSDENHELGLKKIYDMRTWEMYLRITSARRKVIAPQISIPIQNTTITNAIHPSVGEKDISSRMIQPEYDYRNNNFDTPMSQQEFTFDIDFVTQGSEHEMIFGDLDE